MNVVKRRSLSVCLTVSSQSLCAGSFAILRSPRQRIGVGDLLYREFLTTEARYRLSLFKVYFLEISGWAAAIDRFHSVAHQGSRANYGTTLAYSDLFLHPYCPPYACARPAGGTSGDSRFRRWRCPHCAVHQVRPPSSVQQPDIGVTPNLDCPSRGWIEDVS